MHQYSLTLLASALLYSHGVVAAEFAQLAIEWCLDHPDAEGGYAQCVSKVVCKPPGQTSGTGHDSVACVSYGECDCSRFKNKDSDEYFQCISNSNCAACTSPDITPVPSTSSIYELETLAPGTYTLTYDGTTKTAVVPPPTATVTDLTAVTVVSAYTMTVAESPTARTTLIQTPTYKTTTSILATQTTEDPTARTTLTQSPSYKTTTSSIATQTTANVTESTAPTSTAPPLCPSYCDCEPKYGDTDAYEACLQQPECAGCGIPFPPLPDPIPEPTATSCQNSTTKPAPQPTPSCAAWCDCSKIADKSSNAYFQCVTDPNYLDA
ncbi:hypothetical protein LMH87_007115 [Akanthomyces muscarius]|uniref:Uncharacterized protein n=1 Tax=Akanthomyces muscarius TaxID=2231603 RepID=A0A9W8QP23_AKAMU|nr:hypothetical protein LMH87_007115 [Akanthomyces muscarius]KAJ4165483.1 hypothetical protein LMH87_007115 [Akanthomyces muscarius]